MDQITSLQFQKSLWEPEIELQEIRYESGGMPMLRLRIKERGARFTIFDVDPLTTKFWAEGKC